MAYLFDTDAISELLRPRPLKPYIKWLTAIPREDQFTSAVTVGELLKRIAQLPKNGTWRTSSYVCFRR